MNENAPKPEVTPKQERMSVQAEKQRALGEIAKIVKGWVEEFKQAYAERPEEEVRDADVMYEFAAFLRERSSKLLKEVRAVGEYRKEEATAKIHEFNLIQAESLARSAEFFEFYPEAADILAQTYPWIAEIKEWVEGLKK